MNWYLARRLMAGRVAGRLGDYEECFFLVKAASLRQAKVEARRLSKDAEHSYANAYNRQVAWQLERLLDTNELDFEPVADAQCIYRRVFPRVSRIEERSRDHLSIDGHVQQGKDLSWYGAMLLFRTCGQPSREEERLFLFKASHWGDAQMRALLIGKDVADASNERLVGLFQVYDILSAQIRSGTEVYCRSFLPSELKRPGQPPRESHLTIPDFRRLEANVRASA